MPSYQDLLAIGEPFDAFASRGLPAEIETVRTAQAQLCLLYTSPSPRDVEESRMPSSA